MQKVCAQCRSAFEITDEDLAFLERVSPVLGGQKCPISPPTLCPDCRMQRRMAFRNERTFYRRTCDKTKRNIVSIYSPDSPHVVYHQSAWWKDNWDPMKSGRDFDFRKPFFEQYRQLLEQTPLIGMWQIDCENAEYNNTSFRLKNSYMNASSDEGEDIYYCYVSEYGKSNMDSAFVQHCEICYECVDCDHCYQCFFVAESENSHDCYFSSDLIGCSNCFGCHGLRQKQWCLFNQAIGKDRWHAFFAAFRFTKKSIEDTMKESEEVQQRCPRRPWKIIQCEHSSGDHLYQCKNCTTCFDVHNGEDLQYVAYAPWRTKDTQDCYAVGGIELCYESTGGADGGFHGAFLNGIVHGPVDSYYCTLCVNGCRNCFGCVSLKKREYCVFNKQYTEGDYANLARRMIEHMKTTGEWGEFFPVSISPFAYNETIAHEFFPLTREEAHGRGWKWKDEIDQPQNVEKVIHGAQLPSGIDDIPDDILNWAIECTASKRRFRIVKRELEFYRSFGLPIPNLHPDERHRRRMAKRNPRKLYDRICAKCGATMQTTYAPERPEIVYCESCYFAEVY